MKSNFLTKTIILVLTFSLILAGCSQNQTQNNNRSSQLESPLAPTLTELPTRTPAPTETPTPSLTPTTLPEQVPFGPPQGEVSGLLVTGRHVEFTDWDFSFDFPSDVWSTEVTNYGKNESVEIFTFNRRFAIEDKEGMMIRPSVSLMFYQLPETDMDLIIFSGMLRANLPPFEIESMFGSYGGSEIDLKLENALGYFGSFIADDGTEYNLFLVHTIQGKTGVQIILETTTSVYDLVLDDYIAILQSVGFE